MKIRLSIVVPTKNRSDKLANLFESIKKQQADPRCWELIVIDNGSTDNTRYICEKWKNDIDNFKYVYDEGPGLHVGRNRGIQESEGSVIAYLDDDIVLFPNWIQTGIDAFGDPKLMAANGSVIPGDFELISDDLWKYKRRINGFEVLVPISCFWERGITEKSNTIRPQRPELLFGGNCFYRKNLLEECKGFHPDGMPNELIMLRGDGEAHVGNYLRETHAKIMYFSQLSAYHMVDILRVSTKTIKRIQYRNGISLMYSFLRSGRNYQDSAKRGKKLLEDKIYDVDFDKDELKGAASLYINYLLNPSIRKWVHKENYF